MVSINKKILELKEAVSRLSHQQESLSEKLSAFNPNPDLPKELRESFASVLSQQSVDIIKEIEFHDFFNNQPFESLQVYLQEESKNLHREETEKDCVFITGRYRTGTTFLYSLFSSLENTAVFYEPLHPNLLEYLDKEQNVSEQLKALNGHTFKGNYFEEYKVLNRKILFSTHQREFSSRKLIMSTVDSYYDLKNYVSFLTRSLPDIPLKVLQFNRVDFRLGWFKKNFSNALIVNLRRNPRDIYASYRTVNARNTSENNEQEIGSLFYLDDYISILGRLSIPQICVQQMNTYEKIYFLNQLSNLWSDYFADIILDYEELVEDPVGIVSRIASQVKGFEPNWKSEILAAKKDRINVWQEYHENSWFLKCESKCDNLIDQLLFPSRTNKFPMIIRSEYEQAQSQLHQTQEELEESQSQLHQTQEELEESQSQLHQTQTELEQYKAQLQSTQVELEQSQSQFHQTAASLEEYCSHLHQATAMLEEYQSQLHQLETLWQQSQAQYHQTQRELQQSQAQYHQTQRELQQSQASLRLNTIKLNGNYSSLRLNTIKLNRNYSSLRLDGMIQKHYWVNCRSNYIVFSEN
ncbi:sulfotransferase [Microcoleus sp. PH2017_08_TRC_O_A]|uniref:sulfotransferase n=1 Tax=Microcoleus sp. PH2017_08_TRC_O_A TaxID=2798819 RepID=UPI001DB0BBFC|nr:sulfotransferase [Microcoleus sp. PH2017_08_TRC_O_A]MCC3454676.1 sulfotransferase [Microcoleus sp. PH2017_08_TRC_O_A]